MSKITKQDVIDAYKGKKRKRSQLLFEYYYSDYFSGDYSAEFIAEKISTDLDIPISANMVRIAKHRIGKSANSSSAHQQLRDQLREELLQVIQIQTTKTIESIPAKIIDIDSTISSPEQIKKLTPEELNKLIESPTTTIDQLEQLHQLVPEQIQKMVVYAEIKKRKEKQGSQPRRRSFE